MRVQWGQVDYVDPTRATGKSRSARTKPLESNDERVARSNPSPLLRALDVVISVLMIVYLLPVFLTIAVLIHLEDGGPIFFVQTRVGRHGKPFSCFKFRSMHVAGDEIFSRHLQANPHEQVNWQQFRKLDQDPRITLIGRFLRKTSLDEFPQLINVLKGEMSLVGPRPIMPDEIKKYGSSYPYYTAQVPGITGLWQIMGRNSLTYFRRVALDRMLARRQSLGIYLRILVMTIPAVLLQRGAR